jgi:hypothetical protein
MLNTALPKLNTFKESFCRTFCEGHCRAAGPDCLCNSNSYPVAVTLLSRVTWTLCCSCNPQLKLNFYDCIANRLPCNSNSQTPNPNQQNSPGQRSCCWLNNNRAQSAKPGHRLCAYVYVYAKQPALRAWRFVHSFTPTTELCNSAAPKPQCLPAAHIQLSAEDLTRSQGVRRRPGT